MTVLVTGGAGFIGGNFVYYMLKKHPDYKIVCVDCLTYAGNMSTLKSAMENKNFVFYKTDICDRAGIYKIFENEKPDIVAAKLLKGSRVAAVILDEGAAFISKRAFSGRPVRDFYSRQNICCQAFPIPRAGQRFSDYHSLRRSLFRLFSAYRAAPPLQD